MPLTYTQRGKPADTTTAAYEVRVKTAGPGRGDDKSVPVSRAAIQAAMGGSEALKVVLASERQQKEAKK